MKYWILISDASEARIFSTTGRKGPLELVQDLPNPAGRARTQDLVTDEPGRYRKGGARAAMSAMDPGTSAHDTEAIRFAHRLAQVLKEELQRGAYDALAIVAPPQFLGLLRESLSKEVEQRVWGSLHADLTKIAPHDLRAHLGPLFEPGVFRSTL